MNFDRLEEELNAVMFDRFGTEAVIYTGNGESPISCAVIFDMSYQAVEPDGYARVTKAVEIKSALNPKTGNRIDFKNQSWKLLKKLEDDGYSSVFEVTAWQGS